MKSNIPNKIKNKHFVMPAITIGLPLALLLLVMSIKLIIEERYLPSTGFMIASILMFIFILFVFFDPEIQTSKRVARKISKSRSKPIIDSEMIYASKDPVEISHIKEALTDNEINCFIFDVNASGMMGFLQEVEMRVMVHKDDYEKSMAIVTEIIKQVEQEEERKRRIEGP